MGKETASPMMRKNRDILTLKQASRYLTISHQILYLLARNKKVPCFKVGGRWRFRKSTLNRWMERQERESGAV